MSDNCCTFAPEIGKDMLNYFIRRSVTGNAGERPERNSRMKNTYRRCADEKSGAFTDFGFRSFRILDSMIPTYILFWRIIFDAIKCIGHKICEFFKALIL